MTHEVPAISPLSLLARTMGYSDEAIYIQREAADIAKNISASVALSGQRDEVMRQLEEVLDDCGLRNWDGYGAEPVTLDAFKCAYRFLEALPCGLPMPTLAADTDGHITLEWYSGPTRVLSVSISPEAELFYAALLGRNQSRGSECFSGDVPETVLHLIKRVYGL